VDWIESSVTVNNRPVQSVMSTYSYHWMNPEFGALSALVGHSSQTDSYRSYVYFIFSFSFSYSFM